MSMKLWQLDSILCANYGQNRRLSVKVAGSKEEWHYLKPLFSEIFTCQDRDILDALLPEDFVKQVLDESGLVCYIGNDKTIWSRKYGERQEISAKEIYLRHGGEVLERIFERGIAGDSGEL